ncbi:uncharacterized protein CC84DRAFT_1217588 [Paraphaeosphaeria sporulosa]|uniref:Uncharacterized protein n=1 Tax=Paraphaeosphaeria sporulosa TaxID=1460663 RepID=A0A177CHN5_9PLEO|nr:uncharacterized protein CC84DRAFT_1217588 [Paraphaeosphaeria sporulosa]OAG06359.1 hypothetical protein CC84DRAFT_1217588 [Paraphaeosphaeria sporulosa]
MRGIKTPVPAQGDMELSSLVFNFETSYTMDDDTSCNIMEFGSLQKIIKRKTDLDLVPVPLPSMREVINGESGSWLANTSWNTRFETLDRLLKRKAYADLVADSIAGHRKDDKARVKDGGEHEIACAHKELGSLWSGQPAEVKFSILGYF